MKILIYSDYYQKMSGYSREIRDLIPWFQRAGHEIAHVALGYNGYPLNLPDGVKVYPAVVNSENSYWAEHILEYAIDDFKPDVVFTRQDYFALPHIAFNLAKPNGFKWVHWGLADGEPLGKNLEEPIRWIHSHIFTTEFTKRVVKAQNSLVDGEIVYPPINPQTWDKRLSKSQLRAKFGLTAENIIISVARNQPRKNIPCLLEAFKDLLTDKPDSLLILVAHDTVSPNGEPAGYNIEHLVNYFGIGDNVLMPGRIDGKILDDEAMAEIYAVGDIFALPTMGEGFGLIYGEAMYAGLPIVTTDYSACTEVCRNKGVLVKPANYIWDVDNVMQAVVNPIDFADGMRRALNASDKQKEEWIKNGREFVDKITPEKQAEKILKVIEDSVNNDVKPLALQ